MGTIRSRRNTKDRFMSTMTYEDAKRAEGQKFQVMTEDQRELELTLQTVTLRQRPTNDASEGQRDTFTLLFRSAPGHYCDQQTYTLKNPTLGEQQIFIVPVECDEATETYTYEAVFS
jgi:hypothetical protein